MAASHVGLCALLFLVLGAHGAQVTPMEKVITLLKDLSAKVTAEGTKEAAQYDKYACFCKEQADEKLYSIEKSDEQISSLNAEIKELDTAIAFLNSEVSDLSKKSSSLEEEIKTKTDNRNKDHGEYLAKAKDMNEAIDACGAALEALKNSKSAMKGAKLSNLQVQKATGALLSAVSQMAVSPGTLVLLAELSGKGAPAFQYQSNDIIATIEGLQATFKKLKMNLDMEEHDINSAFESDKLGLSNENKFALKEKGEKETIAEAKTEQVNTARTDKDAETNNRNADQKFMDDLTQDCETKAGLFDQRSKTRADELTALAEATSELQKGTVPNYSANKKLAGIAVKAVAFKKRVVGIAMKAVVKKAAILPVEFIQVVHNEQQDDPRKAVVVKKVLALLKGAAGRTGSAVLSSAAMRATLAEDHFVKVRALIKDLLTKLAADAKAESTHKGFCDKGISKAVAGRDDAKAKIEVADAKITTFTAKQNALEDDISTLQKDVAGLNKGLLEATELRGEEKADNAKTINMSDEAIDSVKRALELLKQFYGNALVQTHKYTPPKSDRDGNTVGDLAPEFGEEKYHGSQSESKGILGILEVILSDFERTNKKTTSEEADSKAAFEKLEKETKEDVTKKQKEVKRKQGEVTDTKSDIIDQQQALSDAKDLLESSQASLEDLQAMCVKGEETWEERKQKREDEIEALKNAMEIFDNWQSN